MEKCRIVFSGSGGQGVITAAIIIAEAAVLHENLVAVQSQVYGPAARGGAARSDVIISDSTINYPMRNTHSLRKTPDYHLKAETKAIISAVNISWQSR